MTSKVLRIPDGEALEERLEKLLSRVHAEAGGRKLQAKKVMAAILNDAIEQLETGEVAPLRAVVDILARTPVPIGRVSPVDSADRLEKMEQRLLERMEEMFREREDRSAHGLNQTPPEYGRKRARGNG